MNHILLGEISNKEVITTGYDREDTTVKIEVNITPRELNMLDIALHRLWFLIKDGTDMNCEQLKNVYATYHMLKTVEFWNNEVKSNIEKSN